MLNKNRHREILILILSEIYRHPKLSPLLGFKGGTALYLFHQLDRFSVDLDFDLLDKDQEKFVYDSMLEILSRYGEIKDHALKNFGVLISLSYEKNLHQLKVDISNRQSNGNYEVINYLGIPMRVMKLEDMAANKLVALVERKKPAARDIFDLYFILNNRISINRTLVENKTGVTFEEQLRETIEYLEKNFRSNLLETLGELVEPSKKDWVKDKMKAETILKLKIHLDSLVHG